MANISPKEVHSYESFIKDRHTTPITWHVDLYFILDNNDQFVESFILFDWEDYIIFYNIEDVVDCARKI